MCKFIVDLHYTHGVGRCSLLQIKLELLSPAHMKAKDIPDWSQVCLGWVCDLYEPEDDSLNDPPYPWNDPWIDIGGEG
jgi:hypothetical protein